MYRATVHLLLCDNPVKIYPSDWEREVTSFPFFIYKDMYFLNKIQN